MNNRSSFRRRFRALLACAILLAVLFAMLGARPLWAQTALQQPLPPQSAATYWTPLMEAAAPRLADGAPLPARYQLWQLDLAQMNTLLASVPAVDVYAPASAADAAAVVVALPLSNGTLADFAVVNSPIMESGLAAQYPTFRTLAGYAIQNPAVTVRLGVTSLGFHATIWGTDGATWIDTLDRSTTEKYIVYDAADAISSGNYVEGPIDRATAESAAESATVADASALAATGDQLYTYRIAVSATGEYTQYFGGTVELGMSAIVAAVNRVSGIYMRDLAIRFVLVTNNNLLVHTDSLTDPFTDNDANALLEENQERVDAVIGNANYDIGHVFGTGAGGLGSLGVVCQTGFKARGATGSVAPTGDPFWVDYVAHEIGHQFNADHTFNNNSADSCAGNRNGATAWEPGSGSTIMSYAGICATENLQANSDDYFHIGSIDTILAFTRFGMGGSCPVITLTGNTPPKAHVPAGDFTIPYSTPFTLPGGGTDANGTASLTYTWEQFDLGPAGSYTAPMGDAPIVRSVAPTATLASRTIPRMASLVNNTTFQAESLPTTTRTLHFRLSVRDNNPAGGGLDSAPLAVKVTTGAGPFAVTAPNTALTWPGGTTQTVTWNVANTNAAPVLCATVDLFLSLDGGYTYPYTLVTATPNDGSAQVQAPHASIPNARVIVRCSNNLFFDISDSNFSITGPPPAAMLEVEKVASPASGSTILPLSLLEYTVTVRNTGTLTATGVVIDEFDSALVNPQCDGMPNSLVDSFELGIGDEASFHCVSVVDDLKVEVSHTPGKNVAESGETVDYTITVTNPNDIDLENVIVTSDHGVPCVPALGAPFTMGPYETATFVCAGVVINADVTYTASVTAQVTIESIAEAFLDETPEDRVYSNAVSHTVALSATQDAEVLLKAPKLSVTKSVAPAGTLAPGDAVTYTIAVANSGGADANVTLTDHFAAPLVEPVCDGVSGNLSKTRLVAIGQSFTVVCTANVSDLLGLAISIKADRDLTPPSAIVTYTIVVTNPNDLPISQVVVAAPLIQATCDANPATPMTLAPQQVMRYVCPVSGDVMDVTASVTAQLSFTNVAQVASTGVAGSPFSSPTVTSTVDLAATATAEVRNYLTPINR